jgi:hypothetical protein
VKLGRLGQTKVLEKNLLHCYFVPHKSNIMQGGAIAQVVISSLPTAATWVRSQFMSCGICGVQSGTGAGLIRVLRYPVSIFIPPSDQYSLIMNGYEFVAFLHSTESGVYAYNVLNSAL